MFATYTSHIEAIVFDGPFCIVVMSVRVPVQGARSDLPTFKAVVTMLNELTQQ
jgi:hypothetical protein